MVFFYAGSMIYNLLLSFVSALANDGKRFKTAVKRYLWIIPSIAWSNTVIKTCHDIGSFHMEINLKLAEL